ncbi:hypothetical protein G7Y89_g3138 [Cudoniella acicularis]|uniref:Uncharacterized protein n=1 Tax=Cudoniella acicularis TaxID=354080 RepID=A0A8H4RRZ8_9HELO|nr:hypothetical protein G7Y89_g3138 [Cudoniella acicularis]
MVAHLASLPSAEVGVIFATIRSDSAALNELVAKYPGRISIIKLDATDKSSIEKAAAEVEHQLNGKGLDVLINNAGKMGFSPAGIKTMNDLEDHFITNVVSVQLVTQAFISLLEKGKGKKIANISSTFGTIGKAQQFIASPAPAYKISKAALNALTVQWALQYEKAGFVIFPISPGWLKTDLGGGDIADLPVEVGAKATLDKILGAGKEQNGKFLNIHVKGWENNAGVNSYDGLGFPW